VTNKTILPPAPPETPTPKKKRWPWILGGVVVALFAIGLLNPTDTETTPTTTTPTVSEPTTCLDADAAAAKTSHASDMLTAGGRAASNGDAVSAATFARSAASDFHEVAVLTELDPAISVSSEQTADHLDAAAAAIDDGQWTLAGQELDAAGDSLDQTTAAIGLTDAPIC
jgi:hypothetical protein